ncbi:MAG: DUF4180 domain-containing protein [Bacteroidales bacterium]|nr:DUF4180 domain-containing protein [Bacteroidales bacterium]HPD95031.1 DUF4180 domain-containing protein [Tenuifilaceae bacterium]HRX32220.1 DUF4180 domain-containing protein [Tenuifilaceae bacterium]
MKLEVKSVNGFNMAEVISEEIVINETQDALDIMADAGNMDASRIIIHERNIVPDFFNLSTGIAGEILQKFSTYSCKLAIIGDFSKFTSKSLKDFIYESNKHGQINFVNSAEQALQCLSK